MKRFVLLLIALLIAFPAAQADSHVVTGSTPKYGCSYAQSQNIEKCCDMLSEVKLGYGDTFSFNELVGPRRAEYGYVIAKNGRGVDVVGGGVAQVAATLYQALLQLDDIQYNSLYFYGSRYTGSYVSDGYYAVLVDYENELDFSFTSYFDGIMSIYLWTDSDNVYCLISEDNEEYGSQGYASTPLSGTHAKINNINLACSAIDGTTLAPYQVFSFNNTVGPRLAQYGYAAAVNGRGVSVIGGGVAQVASTIYLAVRDMPCVTLSEKQVYANFTESYVLDPDAAILTDYANGIDFSFYYTGDGTLSISTYIADGECVCSVQEY